jgi:EPS-associated MarR family transcriptional regulator
MFEQSQKEEILHIIKAIETDPKVTQRTISGNIGISLGKTNYLLRELILKGFIKAKNFTDKPGKLKKIHYFLTEKGLEEKIRLIKYFLQIKEVEYNKLKQENDLLIMTHGG